AERGLRATVGADRDPFVTALRAETPRRHAVDEDDHEHEAAEAARDAVPAIIRPAADPMTAAEAAPAVAEAMDDPMRNHEDGPDLDAEASEETTVIPTSRRD